VLVKYIRYFQLLNKNICGGLVFKQHAATPIRKHSTQNETFLLSFFVVFLLYLACLKVHKHEIFWFFLV
jgi:hypothetical protein